MKAKADMMKTISKLLRVGRAKLELDGRSVSCFHDGGYAECAS